MTEEKEFIDNPLNIKPTMVYTFTFIIQTDDNTTWAYKTEAETIQEAHKIVNDNWIAGGGLLDINSLNTWVTNYQHVWRSNPNTGEYNIVNDEGV